MEIETYLQHIREVVAESPTIVVYLIAGLLLLFAGLYVFKGVQFVICAVLGGLLGIAVLDVTGHTDLYYLAGIPALLFGIIGVWKYKAALYIAGSLCTFGAVALWFLKQAYAMVRKSVAAIPDTDTLLRLWVEQVKEKGDLAAAAKAVIGEQTAPVMNELKDAMQFLEKGLLTAFLAGVVIGVLALLLGDYIIILFTSVSGAMLVVSTADRIYELPDQTYNIALGVLALIGLLLQCIHKWDRKNVKKDKKEKKERRR
ncbi:MAG: hypothetical protein J6M27_06510 [Lachnospiraceae bacterium]|nr:hypothetical protein [Lachnospiraceae bacterium]